MLLADKVYLRYGNREVLSNASLCVPSGMITGLFGPSGCGKSSLLTLLAGLEPPQAGNIREVTDGVRSSIGVVFQRLALWPHLTLGQNLLFARKYHNNALSTKEISRYIKLLGIGPILNQYPSEASLGEQQRVAFLRALAIRPSYLLLDEPTSALDDISMQNVEKILLERRDDGVGILLVSHDRPLVERVSDQIFLIKGNSVELYQVNHTSESIDVSHHRVADTPI